MINSKNIYIKAYTRINLGDDLFIHIICSRYPECKFYLKSKDEYTNVFEQIPNLIIVDDVAKIEFDAIVYIGGSIFIENSKASIGRVYELKKEIIRENIPTYIIGANFGPYMTEEYRSVVKNEIISNVENITFRDKYSYNLFKDMPNVSYAPDVVFSLHTSKEIKATKKEIGISVIHHLEREKIKNNYYEYLDKLEEIIKYYISIGYEIRLLSFCEYEKDMVTIQELLDRMEECDKTKVNISNYTGNVDEILKQISGLDILVATRFHSMILGFAYEIPVIPICYSGKMKNVLVDIGFDKNEICDFESLNSINYKKQKKAFGRIDFNLANNQFKYLDKFVYDK